MTDYRFPVYQEDDLLYVSAFGIEDVGKGWGPGRRAEGIIHYILKGEGTFNGHKVRENQGFYIAPNSFCEYYPDPADPWKYFWIDCSAMLATRYAFPALRPDENGIFNYDFSGKILSVSEKIFGIERNMSSVEALGYLFSVLMQHTPVREVSRSAHYVRQAKNYIESSLNRRLSVCDVAEAISVHDRYLYALFVQYEGISPKEYILKRKMETAMDLLTNTDLPVSEVATATGFADVYGFSRLFKSKQGISPSQYRKSLSK